MDTSVQSIERLIESGQIRPEEDGGETLLSEQEMCRIGALLYLQETDGLTTSQIDRILERFILPWSARPA